MSGAKRASQSRTASWVNSKPRSRNISGRLAQAQFVPQPPENHKQHDIIPIRVLSDKFEWQVTHEHAAKCYQLERILVSVGYSRKLNGVPVRSLKVRLHAEQRNVR